MSHTLRIGGLFEGYGGLTMGVRAVLGGEPAWYSEIDPAACRVLVHHHPEIPNLGDIATVNWLQVQPVDVLLGGFPCQDISSAGRRAGMHPGNQSGLWSHMAHAISALKPGLVVIENVRGILSADAACDLEPGPWGLGDRPGRPLRALGAVLGDLADCGYDARWCGLRAADVGAPHGRFRLFIAAMQHQVTRSPGSARGPGVATANPSDPGLQRTIGAQWKTASERVDGCPRRGAAPECDRAIDWGVYGPAIRRWERILDRSAPAPTQAGKPGGQLLSARFVEWMMGLPEGHVTNVPGLSRNDQLKLLGKGVVPGQAASALSMLLATTLERAA